MKTFFSALSRNVGTLLLSLAIVAGLSYYLLSYVPERTASLNARYFRVLARVGENIKDKIDAQHFNDEGDARSISYLMSYSLPTFWQSFLSGSKLPTDRGPMGFVEAANRILADRSGPEKYHITSVLDTGLTKCSLRLVGSELEFESIVPPSPMDDQPGWLNNLQAQRHLPPAASRRTSVGVIKVGTARGNGVAVAGRTPGPAVATEADSTYALTHIIPIDSLVRELRRPEVFDYFLVVTLPDHRLLYSSGQTDSYLDGKGEVAAAGKDESKANKQKLPRWLTDSTLVHTGQAGAFAFGGQAHQVFAQPVQLGPHLSCLLVGGVPRHHFDSERRALRAGWPELLVGALLLGVLALPFLKLWLISPREQIHRHDVVLSAASLVLGSGVLLLTLKAILFYSETDTVIKPNLTALAEDVASDLHNELRQLNITAQQADSIAIARRAMRQNDVHGAITLITNVPYYYFYSTKSPLRLGRLGLLGHLSDYDYITWIKQNGQAVYGLDLFNKAPDKYPDALAKSLPNCLPLLAKRAYLKKITHNSYQQISDDKYGAASPTSSQDSCYFEMLRTVRSVSPLRAPVTADENDAPHLRAVLARPSRGKDTLVCAFETRLVCFDDRIIPPGYGFCLIEPNGEVLAHSDPRLNLSENLLTDCEPASELRAVLYTQQEQPGKAIEVVYQGRPMLMYVHPMAGMRRYLITFFDMGYLEAQQHQTFLLALSLLGGFWLLAAAIVLLAWLVLRFARRGSPRDRFRSLWPHPAGADHYWQVAASQAVGLVVLSIVSLQVGPFSQLCLLVVAPLLLFILTYHHIRWQPAGQPGMMAWVVGLVGSLLVFILPAYWYVVSWREFAWVMGFTLGLGGLVSWWLRQPPAPASAPPGATPRHYRRAYVAMLLGWIGLLGVVPALHCYRVAQLVERLQVVRAGQLKILESYEQHEKKNLNPDNGDYFFYHAKFFFGSELTLAEGDTTYHKSPLEQAALQFFAGARKPMTETGGEAAKALFVDKTLNAQWHPWWIASPVSNKRCSLPGNLRPLLASDTLLVTTQDNASGSQVVSRVPWLQMGWPLPLPRSLPKAYSWLLVGLTWALLAGGLWALVSYLLRRLFGLSADEVASLDSSVASPPLAGPTQRFWVLPGGSAWADVPWAEQMLKDEQPRPAWPWQQLANWAKPKPKVQVLDCRQYALLPEAEWQKLLAALTNPDGKASQSLPLVLASFDYRPADSGFTQRKTELLIRLQQGGWPLVVLSASHPDAFRDCGHPLEKPCPDAGHRPLREAGERLLDALGEFRLEYFPLQSAAPERLPAPPDDVATALFGPATTAVTTNAPGYPATAAQDPPPLRTFFEDECQAFPFVASLRVVLLTKLWQQHQAGHQPAHGAIETTVQRLAQLHFRRLWLALSPQEKFLLFDLAQDGLVNTDNALALSILLQKGFLRRDGNGRLSLRSASFRGFIRTDQRKYEAMQYVAASKQGTWAATQTPLLLLLAAGATFLFITQPTTFTQTQTFLVGLAGLLPALAGLLKFLLTPKVQASPVGN